MENRAEVEIALKAGILLLSSGAEIWRVEETMRRILEGFGLANEDIFVLSNGMFFTIEMQNHQTFAKVRHIPIQGTKLYIIAEVNELSRGISAKKISVEDAMKRLGIIEKMQGKKLSTLAFAAFFGSGGFSYLSGQNIRDALVSAVSGVCVFLVLFFLSSGKRSKMHSKLTLNILGGMIAVGVTRLLFSMGVGVNMNVAVSGAIMTMIPGVALVTAVRDLANADYIAGLVRLFDALLITFGIAIGVYIMNVVFQRI